MSVTMLMLASSNFLVGAAVLAEDEQNLQGLQCRKCFYGLCNCAERTAIFTAVAAGNRKIKSTWLLSLIPLVQLLPASLSPSHVRIL